MNKTNTRKALNPAYRKHKPLRKKVTHLIGQLQNCINAVKLSDDNGESEEHIKSHFKDFFTNTFYNNNYINTKERIDLAIYLDGTANSDVGVIIEAKKPSNKAEFLTENNLNRKALQELLLYYLRERVDNENNNIKHLIATNGYEWYLFKAEDFYNYFYKNKALLREYRDFRDGLKDTTKNELFYNEIAKKYIAEVEQELPFAHLDFSKTNFNKLSDAHLNTLYKIFSDVHILGHSFGNDSNQLNKAFYNELLHIIGLEEVKDKGKKIISRKSEKDRDYASLLENTIVILEDRDYLSNIESIENNTEKSFNAGLELCLTWVNRILFLKLLESQLLAYHKQNPKYKFLNASFISDYDELNDLFFSALAKNEDERHPKYKEKYKDIPYLNSSLFERNTLENEAFEISALNNDDITLYNNTVLKDNNNKQLKGKLSTLEYLFKFLEAYDFATDGNEGIEDEQENKSLINASVLGLIFEKINGYKEGSFYTPAYITMYMCRETLRRAVVQKFNVLVNDQIETFKDLQSYCSKYFKTDDLERFNKVVNSLRLCDPAVGSGHFLVSALNELIVIKNELGILVDAKGIPLRCDIEIVNDELYVIDDRGSLFEYNPDDKESVRIQHTLFHQKQTLIENCLFGVDINPNSVKICRLRLWIELLKNAYYTKENRLQTLPNIDINIKCGNSLISRFKLDDDLKDAFRNKKNPKLKYTFTDYKNAVSEYKETNSKDRKREVLEIIDEVKDNFKSTLDSKFITVLEKAKNRLFLKEEQIKNLKQFGEKITKAEKERLKELKKATEEAYLKKQEIVNNAIYLNAFEWRFEFPEVLADDGSFIGFDALIGNPPYAVLEKQRNSSLQPYQDILEYSKITQRFKSVEGGKLNLYRLFIHLCKDITRPDSNISYIIPLTLIGDNSLFSTRKFISENFSGITLHCFPQKDIPSKRVFEDAKQSTLIFFGVNDSHTALDDKIINVHTYPFKSFDDEKKSYVTNFTELLEFDSYRLSIPLVSESEWIILKKIHQFEVIRDIDEIRTNRGEINQTLNRRYISNKPGHADFLKGVQIGPYRINKKLSQGEKEYFDEKLYNEDGRVNQLSEIKRIGIQRITGVDEKLRIVATIVNPKIYFADSTNSVISEEPYSLNVLAGLLNSKLFQWRFKKTSSNNNVSNTELESLPIAFDKYIYKEIEHTVTEILKIKNVDPKADTKSLEESINKMVYRLYGLSKEEIKVVEEG
ncbi:hypothetical protein FGM00_08355 [Aggregatimonas sangjinii]|uniref:site-specific DNA-methyltransferase (adenine-specific) n=1 Tax=Aggregatimonas sangjinii TaxID=2583587 RepID=A0A5B7STS4_9FLAO|nr:TaqI-like C-terminal specificity domain-containing protein [Aggregatimonas sangjinii]QCX00114.1 hypothetical protein FGM00_08355 [Aggregatimonas sangjinii]